MLGVTESYGHLLPSIKSERDIGKIFGQIDPLEMTPAEKRKAQT